METYPTLTVSLTNLTRNAKAIVRACAQHGISVAGVIKGAGGAPPVRDAVWAGGVCQLASSRIAQLKAAKEALPQAETLLIRLPQLCETEEVVRWCDYSLNSASSTLKALNECALAQGRLHRVILMYELGDLREGVPDLPTLLSLARLAEELPGLELAGIGGNLNDFYGICPSSENMQALVAAAEAVEDTIGRPLALISGGSTTALPMMLEGKLPPRINHLRVGEAILAGQDLPYFWHCTPENVCGDTLLLQAQVIEAYRKPTLPRGRQQTDAFGKRPALPPDRGMRRRVLLALGRQDIGDPTQLIPLEPGAKVLEASSDHTLVDVEDCARDFQPGDVLGFRVFYQAMLFAFQSESVRKIYR